MANENIIKLSEGFGEGTVGDVLTLKDENTVGWQTPQGGSTYTPGSMIQIDNDTIDIKNISCSADGVYSYALGLQCLASEQFAHAEGIQNTAAGTASHAEGCQTKANGSYTHTEGYYTSAKGTASHAEGNYSLANALNSHAEGNYTSAEGAGSHAEGNQSDAIGSYSHAEGNACSAIEYCSHAEGGYTIANDQFMHVAGTFNDTTSGALFVIGNGTSNAARSDAFIVYPTGQVSGSDFTTNGVSLSGMLVLYNALTARPLTGSYTLKCVDGVLTWEGEVPSNAISVNNEQVGVNNEGFGINDNPSPTPSYNYIILQNFLDGHTIGTPISEEDYSDFNNTYPADKSAIGWSWESNWSDTNLVSTTAGSQLLYSEEGFDFSKYGLTSGQIPFGFVNADWDWHMGAGYRDITLPTEFTYEVWFNSPNNDWEGTFIAFYKENWDALKIVMDDERTYIMFNGDTIFSVDKYEPQGGGYIYEPDQATYEKAFPLSAGQWHHFALSCDGTNLYVFIDGKLLGTIVIANINGLAEFLATAMKEIDIVVDDFDRGQSCVYLAQIALCDECKWTDDYVPPKYAY